MHRRYRRHPMFTTATNCTKCQLPMNLHGSPPLSPSPRRLPRSLRSLSLSLNPSPRLHQRLSRKLSLNRNSSCSCRNLNNPRAQLHRPSSLPHPVASTPGSTETKKSTQKLAARRMQTPGDGTLGTLTPPSATPVHSTPKLTPQHMRPNRPVSRLTSQSPHPAAVTANGTASPCVVPSPTLHAVAVDNRHLAIPHARPHSLFLSLRKGALRLNFKTRFNNINSKKALRHLLKRLKWFTTRHCELVKTQKPM